MNREKLEKWVDNIDEWVKNGEPWHFWNPCSGFLGGAVTGLLVILILKILGII